MTRHHASTIALAGLAAGALLGAPTVAAAMPDADVPAQPRGAVAAEGDVLVSLDFTTLQFADVRGNKCELTLDATLSFDGTVEGDAVGTTTAVIFAPCDQALTDPPGTYFDLFAFDGQFTGEVLDEPVSGPLSYTGKTHPGGAIDARVRLGGDDAMAVLRVDAHVLTGAGTYVGIAKSS